MRISDWSSDVCSSDLDDVEGSGDITAAVKLNGSFGETKYGVFVADESGEAGRTFGALRLVRDFNTQDLGLMLTRVDRPYLDREATVIGVAHNWRPNERWNIRPRGFGRQVWQPGQEPDDLGDCGSAACRDRVGQVR